MRFGLKILLFEQSHATFNYRELAALDENSLLYWFLYCNLNTCYYSFINYHIGIYFRQIDEMGKNNKKGPKANVFKVAGAKSLKKTKAKAVNLGLKNVIFSRTYFIHILLKSFCFSSQNV